MQPRTCPFRPEGNAPMTVQALAEVQTFRSDLTDEVRVHTYRPASLGQERKFDAEIVRP